MAVSTIQNFNQHMHKSTMRKTLSLGIATLIVAVTGTLSTYAQKLEVAATGTKTVTLNDNVGNNQFIWVSDAPGEKINGTADNVTGSFTINLADLTSIRGTISVQVASMKSGNATRDEHLRSPTWLDAKQYPTISFTITSVKGITVNGNKATATAVGNFTLHGVTKPMSIPLSLTWLDESAKTKKKAPGDLVMIEANFNVSLADFNVKGREGVIGSNVGEDIAVTAKLFGSTQ